MPRKADVMSNWEVFWFFYIAMAIVMLVDTQATLRHYKSNYQARTRYISLAIIAVVWPCVIVLIAIGIVLNWRKKP